MTDHDIIARLEQQLLAEFAHLSSLSTREKIKPSNQAPQPSSAWNETPGANRNAGSCSTDGTRAGLDD
ncbi:MAG: hypothetical protein RL563_2695 [Pseudomonadota bacterium]